MKGLVQKMIKDWKKGPCLKDEDYTQMLNSKKGMDHIVKAVLRTSGCSPRKI